MMWQKEQALGKGAFAEVYLVRDARGNRYACKESRHVEILRKEAEIQKGIRHPLFPKYVVFREEAGIGSLVMEYAPGRNLDVLLKENGPLQEAEAVRIALELAEGLEFLHRLQEPLLFRDVKPGNIVVGEAGRVWLLDMGCVCGVGENPCVAGTPGFAAPEQLQFGGQLTASCDVYGLGSTLKAVTGRKCSKRLAAVIEACTRQEPGRRPPDMDWVRELLEACRGSAQDGKKAGFAGKRSEALPSLDGMQQALLRDEVFFQKQVCFR